MVAPVDSREVTFSETAPLASQSSAQSQRRTTLWKRWLPSTSRSGRIFCYNTFRRQQQLLVLVEDRMYFRGSTSCHSNNTVDI